MLVVFLVPRREPLCIKQKNPKMSTSPFDDNDRSLQSALLWYFFEEKKRGQQKTNGTKDRSSQKQKRKTIKCCGRKMYTHNLKRRQDSAGAAGRRGAAGSRGVGGAGAGGEGGAGTISAAWKNNSDTKNHARGVPLATRNSGGGPRNYI